MPIGAILGAVFGGVSSAVGASSQNRQAQEAAARQNEYNKKVYDFQVKEQERQYEYAVEGLEITKRNNEQNLQFQEAEREQQYDYGMGIRQYEYNQEVRAYEASVAGALKQQSFNQLAEQAAITDQNRLIHEQLLSLNLKETQTLFEYGAAAAGLGLQKRQAKAKAATAAQTERISALKATGASVARGASGRSAAKNVQGLLAESGARQAAIIDELMFNTEANEQQLFKMNQQLVMDRAGYEFSRESARMSDTIARTKIAQQALQNAMKAEASIAMVPEIGPPLPKPLALPRPEYQEVFKPGVPPPPMAQVAMQQNMFSSIMGGALSGAQMGASIQSSFGSNKGFQGFQYGDTKIGAGGGSVGGMGTLGPNYGMAIGKR